MKLVIFITAIVLAFLTELASAKSGSSLSHHNKHDEKNVEDEICSSTSPVTGNYFDLRPLIQKEKGEDWHVRGHDFGANFTINICAPVVHLEQNTQLNPNTSAYYTDKFGNLNSLGNFNSTPHFRGRNLLLEYTNGSPCLNKDGNDSGFKKSSTIHFKCDRELATIKNGLISYVTSHDDCSFYFEVRTPHACPSVDSRESISPVTIFFVIASVAVAVYYLGTKVFIPRNKKMFSF